MPSPERLAIFAGLFAGLAFGLFWLPIRAVSAAGFEGPWTMVVFAGFPFLLCIPLIWIFRADYGRDRRSGLMGGLLAGVAFSLYGVGFIYTDVVRAILLFYLMPIWGFLLAWLLAGDRITWQRWLAMGIGILGMAVMFGTGNGLPLPQNIGDWSALVSGFVWAASSLLILTNRKVTPVTQGVSFFGGAAIFSLGLALLATELGLTSVPDWSRLVSMSYWAVPVTILLILPAGLAAVYAPTRLNPGVCGLLFMTEVAMAAISAAIFADEPMGQREIAGLVLVLSAGLLEPAVAVLNGRRRRMVPPKYPAPQAASTQSEQGTTNTPRH